MPKDDEGPPTFVFEKEVVDLENPPDPTPGLTRMPILTPWFGNALPRRSTCETELQVVLLGFVYLFTVEPGTRKWKE